LGPFNQRLLGYESGARDIKSRFIYLIPRFKLFSCYYNCLFNIIISFLVGS
jgi:ABC-type microcin C transport system permease subunit YejE